MNKKALNLICLAFLVLFFLITKVSAANTAFTFTLPGSARTSGGVYNGSGVLLRTLWSGVTYSAGSHTVAWDGTDDQGRVLPDGSYNVRVLSNNVNYQWEGVIGNTSDSFTGDTVQHSFNTIYDMAFSGANGYYADNYTEGGASTLKFSIADPGSVTHLLNNNAAASAQRVATDGNYVYWSSQDGWNTNNTFVYATKVSDDSQATFLNGISTTPYASQTYPSVIDYKSVASSFITGLAVQKTGSYLFVAHAGLNQIDVLNKTTGALVQTITANVPGSLAVDTNDNLWMISGTTVAKYTVNSNGTLSAPIITLANLVAPLALGVSPDGITIAVADGGSSQQVKAYNNNTGVSLWTYGQAGGYANGPAVADDKFYFSDPDYNIHTFIAFAPDGSFWVGDTGNDRAQHYTASRTFINRTMYLPHFYSSTVDANNSTRVFGDFLEFKIDYSKPLDNGINGSWTLVNNWEYNVPTQYNNKYFRLVNVTTLSNGHTYAFLSDASNGKGALVELTPTGVRFTGYEAPNLHYSIYPDGSLRWVAVGSTMVWNEMLLLGFDSLNNPIWGSAVILGSSPVTTTQDPVHGGATVAASPITSSNVLVSFDSNPLLTGGAVNDGYHLGGIQSGTNTWLWRTATSTYRNYVGPFPADGAFDVGNNVQYAGGRAVALGRSIFWGYHGEFWKNGETNKWNQVYDDGLFVGQFGVTSAELNRTPGAPAQLAGNSFADIVVTGTDGNVYLYNNDESDHGGVHRWKITGLNTIAEQSIPVTVASTTNGLLAQYYNGTQINSVNLKTTRVDANVNLLTAPSGTNLSSSNFSTRWSGFVKSAYSQAYTFYADTNSGVRVWVDNTLLIDQWSNTLATEFSGTIALNAGTAYPIRIEYSNGATTSVALLWSSISQPKQIIPSANLYPANPPDTSNGVDLMDGLGFNSVLQDGQYGWNRNPTVEDTTSHYNVKYWSVLTGPMAYNNLQSQDVSASFAQQAGIIDTVTRDLGTNAGLTSWKLSGNINYQNNVVLDGSGKGSYFDVLDTAGKIIARFYTSGAYAGLPITITGNTAQIVQAPVSTIELSVLFKTQPISISAANGLVTFSYAGYAPVTTTVFDPTSNWQSPKTMRMYFSGNGYSYVTDLQNMQFLTSASATPPPVLTPPLLFSTTTPSFPSGTTSMNLSVTTNIPAMCGYSNTANTPYGAMTRFSTTGGTAHSTLISGLTNGTTYTYYVRCADATTSTNVDTTDYPITFSVAAPMLAPLLYSTTPPTYPNSTTTVTLAITTNVTATCAYSPTANTPYASMIRFSNTGSTTHTTTVTGLTDGTSYTYYVRCAGTSNTVNTVDYPIAFAIAAPTVTVPVAPLLYTTTALSFPSGTNSTTLTIVSNMAALCGYSTVANTPYGSMTRFSTTGGTTHTTLLSNLTDGTSYTYYVRCADASNSTNVDTVDYPVAFSIAFPTVIILPPVITSTVATTLPSGTTSTALTVTTTANATCAYSATANTPYSAMTSFTSTGGTTHTTLLSNLTDGTSYTYYVRCAGTSNTVNTVDYPIAFAIAFPVAGTPPPTPAPAGGGGAGGASSSSSTPTSTAPATGGTGTSAPATPTTPSDCTPGVAFSVSTGTACPSVATIPPTPAPVSGNTSQLNGGGLSLTQTLVLGARSPEVQLLQQYLNTHGFQVAITGPGSSGNETAYFGPATKGAVQKFQSVAGLAPVDGVVGPKTRAVLAGTPLTAIIPTPAALPSTASRVRVTATAINLRATIGGTIVGRISHNTVGTVLTRIPSANGLYWVQVQFPTVTGWTSSLYLTSTTMTKPATPTKPASATATPASGHLVVTAATLTLYATPSTSATSITTLTRGTQGTLTATSGTWDQGIFAGVKGWVEQGGVVIY